MNGFVLAVLVVVALIVVALVVLKMRAVQKKGKEEPPERLAQPLPEPESAAEPVIVAEEVITEVAEAEPPPAEPVAEVTTVAPEPEAMPSPEPEDTAATEQLAVAEIEPEPVSLAQPESLEPAEKETAPLEAMPDETPAVVEEDSHAPEQAASVDVEPAVVPEAIEAGVAEPITATEPTISVLEEAPSSVEPPAAAEAKSVEGMFEIPEPVTKPEPAPVALPLVRLSLEDYASRLNALEEQQRAALGLAIDLRDDKRRDQLQRELVIMNDKLALLADSYVEEMACYQQVLDALAQLRSEDKALDPQAAIEALQAGEIGAAEAFLARLSEQTHPFSVRAAYLSGQLAECRVDLQQAMEMYRRAVAKEPGNPLYLRAAGRMARNLYNYREALPWLETFVQQTKEHSQTDPLALALAQRELAYTYVLSGQYQKAGPLYKESMTGMAQRLGQDHPEMAMSWQQIGEFQETLGEYDKAVSLYQKALAILEKKRGPEHPTLAGILDKLAALCMELEMEKQAVPLYERLVRIREKALRPTHPQLVISLNNLAESYRLQGRYAEAEACYLKTLRINEEVHGSEHPSVAAILQELAKLCTSQRKPEEAKRYQERASAIFQKSVEAAEMKSGAESLTLEL